MRKIEYGVLLVAGLVLAAAVIINPSAPAGGSQARKFSSYSELDNFVRSNAESYSGGFYSRQMLAETSSAVKSAQSSGQPAADYSTTNIQVAGVDEADIIKSDGKYIYDVSGSSIVIVDAYPAETASVVSNISIDGTPSQLFVNKDKLVVFGRENYNYPVMKESAQGIAMPSYYSPRSFIRVYDISDRSNPVLERNVTLDGNYIDSRMIGDYVYAIANQPISFRETDPVPLPIIQSGSRAITVPATDIYYFGFPDYSYVYTNVLALNTQTSDDPAVKTFLTGYSRSIFVSLDNIYILHEKRLSDLDFFDRIVDQAIIPNVPFSVQAKIADIRSTNATKYEKMQMTGKAIEEYLGSLNPEEAAAVMKNMQAAMANIQNAIAKEMEKTVIQKIHVDKNDIAYVAGGEVPGYVLNQFSMDEYNGYFRIATTTSPFWGGPVFAAQLVAERQTASTAQITPASGQASPEKVVAPPQEIAPTTISQPTSVNNVYVLDGNMQITGKLEDLAPGERIYSARFIGDKGYLVTFRQIDPLFVIDLSSPSAPKVLGFLKIPGVSDYLHPYDEDHIIGVGRDATENGMVQGMKLSLFDVSDVSKPKEVSKYIIGERGTSSPVLYDHKAFLFSREKNLLVIPVTLVEGGNYNAWSGALAFNVDLTSGFVLKGNVTHTVEQEKLRPAKEEPIGTERKDYAGYVWKKIAEGEWTTNASVYAGIVYKDYEIDYFPGGIRYYSYDYNSQIQRSLYIGDVLYTVSNSMIKMNSLGDMSEMNKLALPVVEPIYRIMTATVSQPMA